MIVEHPLCDFDLFTVVTDLWKASRRWGVARIFFNNPINGDLLPDKILCLTYDDGPGETEGPGSGPHTLQLGQYLFEQGVQATFFMIGERARASLESIVALRDMGHLIANHTEKHADVRGISENGHNPVAEVLPTDVMIRETLGANTTLFRPPWLSWRTADEWHSPASVHLNDEEELARCIGPVFSNIAGGDWEFWKAGSPAEDCARYYLEEIEGKRSGIVLMHDSSFEDDIREGNQSLQMAQILIPELHARGYRFVRLDAVPQVKSAINVSRRVALKAPDGEHYVSARGGGGGAISADGPDISHWEEFGLVETGEDRIALRAPNGQYLSAQGGGGGAVLANGPEINDWEFFTLSYNDDEQVTLRAMSGHYLSAQDSGSREILANGPTVSDWELFSLVDL